MKREKNLSLSKRIVGLSFAATLFILFFFSPSISFSQNNQELKLTEECYNLIESVAKNLGIEIEDLKDVTQPVNTQAMTLKKHLMKIGQWEAVRSVCFPKLEGNSCHDCSKCHCSVSDCCYWGGCHVCNGQCCGGLASL